MRYLCYISLIFIFACEEVIIVDLPSPQNLLVVEGWVSDSLASHPIRITRSNSFADTNQVMPIENARVIVQSSNGSLFNYSYIENGYYHSDLDYRGLAGNDYRIVAFIDSIEIRSKWDLMPEKVDINNIQVVSFEENDPDNPGQQITLYYPKVNALDPESIENYYRWVFSKNGDLFKTPGPITIQNDRLFDGNIIPNNFQSFEYNASDTLAIELQSISQNTHSYLSLLRSQITTLGTSGGTTPAVVTGNLSTTSSNTIQILGYFGAISVSRKTLIIEE